MYIVELFLSCFLGIQMSDLFTGIPLWFKTMPSSTLFLQFSTQLLKASLNDV